MRWTKADRSKWSITLFLLALAIWGLTDVRNRGRVDPEDGIVHRSDVTVYTGAGVAIFDGRDPYAYANPRGWHYLYPPLFAMLMSPLAALDPQWQSVALFAINVLTAWGCYVECRRWWAWLRTSDTSASATNRMPKAIFWLAAATVLLPALNCMQRGQVSILLMYPLLLGFRWAVTGQAWTGMALGGIVMAFPATVKLVPALPVAFVCCELVAGAWLAGNCARKWQQAAAVASGVAVGLLLFLFVLPSLCVGPKKNVEYLYSWARRVAANSHPGPINGINIHSKRNQSLSNAVYRLGNFVNYEIGHGKSDEQLDEIGVERAASVMDQPAVTKTLLMVRGALLLLLIVAGWRALRSGDRLSIALAAAMACLATLIVSPLSWGHYYVIWLPAAALAPAWLWLRGRTHFAGTLAISACGLAWAHYVLMPWTGRIGLLGIGTTGWFAVVCLAMVRLPDSQTAPGH